MVKFIQKYGLIVLVIAFFIVGCASSPYQPSPEMERIFLAKYGSEGEDVLLHQSIHIAKHPWGTWIPGLGGKLVLTNKGIYLFGNVGRGGFFNNPLENVTDWRGVSLLKKWQYADPPPPIIFDYDNVDCYWGGCSSALRIGGYKISLGGHSKYERKAYEILKNQGVQITIFTKEMGKTFLANFGEDGEEVLHEQEVKFRNRMMPWGGNLILTNKGIYLFSLFANFDESLLPGPDGYLSSHQFTEEYLLGKWNYKIRLR